MNSNLPRAARVIHAALRSVPPDQATAAARALNAAHLLTDPARTYGVLLHRSPAGDWSRTGPRPPAPEPQPRLTDPQPAPRRPATQPDRPTTEPEPVRPSTALGRVRPAPESGRMRPTAEPEPVRPSAESGRVRPTAESGRVRPRTDSGRVRPSAESGRMWPTTEPEPMRPTAETEPVWAVTEPTPLRPVTALERQALAWDESCARAREVARSVERQMNGHPGPHGIRVDGDRVRVLLRVDDPAQWARWRAYLGLTDAGERSRPHTVTAQGERDGVPVTVVARGSGTAPPSRAGGPERRPFRLDGTRFDLALPQRDTNGDLWYFQGCRTPDGMPLMSLDGRPERCTLAQVEAQLGPLSPVRPAGRP
ncbi:BN159_2729 family protein [Streptomyces sp. NPDC005811]|uniref:BN159_2729 family protein n=1 Tax=Streptomyces sp. NPDC005811 TaxID=3154565 RepID=UPI0033F6AA0D